MDFDKLHEMIGKYRILLDRERDNAFLSQFDSFLLDAAGIEDEEVRKEIAIRLHEVLKSLVSQDLSAGEILIEFFESEIIQDMIQTKNSARERELRQLTYEFGAFLQQASYSASTEEEFLRNMLRQSLQNLSSEIKPKEMRRKGESMIDVWVRAMEESVYPGEKS